MKESNFVHFHIVIKCEICAEGIGVARGGKGAMITPNF